VAAGQAAIDIIQTAVDNKQLTKGKKELQWLEKLHKEFAALPKDENELAEEITSTMGHLYEPESYGMKVAVGAAK